MSYYKINKKELVENINTLKDYAKVPIIGVVKGNGYGFGTIPFTKILMENGINFFAITETTDIKDLRTILKDEDILILRSTSITEEVTEIINNNCIATVGSLASLEALNKVASEHNIIAKAHIKIDTGMSRYGFNPNQIDSILNCYQQSNINITGIYTHFSSAFRNKELTYSQHKTLLKVIDKIKSSGYDPGIIHCANSPALLNNDGLVESAVRIGSAFTGRVITNNNIGLHRIGSLEAKIVDIKSVAPNTSIGYNGTFTTKSETKIAIVPIGHYDGFGLTKEKEVINLRYILSLVKRMINKRNMYVIINGEKCKVLGGIGLSHTAVDITNKNINIGDIASVDISPLLVNPKLERIYK